MASVFPTLTPRLHAEFDLSRVAIACCSAMSRFDSCCTNRCHCWRVPVFLLQGGDAHAMKSASLEVNGMAAYLSAGESTLHVALATLLDFAGEY